jgi:hypothetical protein
MLDNPRQKAVRFKGKGFALFVPGVDAYSPGPRYVRVNARQAHAAFLELYAFFRLPHDFGIKEHAGNIAGYPHHKKSFGNTDLGRGKPYTLAREHGFQHILCQLRGRRVDNPHRLRLAPQDFVSVGNYFHALKIPEYTLEYKVLRGVKSGEIGTPRPAAAVSGKGR